MSPSLKGKNLQNPFLFQIIFFIVMSSCMTVSNREPQWFLFLFANVLWPMGNISITASVLMVVAVSTER
jgi:hypothetical protein